MATLLSISSPLALGAKAVRGADTLRRRHNSAKVVRSVARAEASTGERAAAAASAAVTFAAAAPSAHASELGEDLFAVFDSIDKAADKVEGAFGVLTGVLSKVSSAVDAVVPVAKPVVDRVAAAAAPIGDAAYKFAERAVVPVVTQAEQVVEGAAGQALLAANDAIKAQGIDIQPAQSAVGTAAHVVVDTAAAAAPVLSDVVDFLTAASPTDLTEVAAAAAAVYFLTPRLLQAAATSVRGYAGSIRPVEAYDAVLSGGNIVVVDVRRGNEVGRGDIEFPRRYSNKVLSVPREKLTGNFMKMNDVEANLFALKMGSLKGIKRSTRVLLLDGNGGDSPKLAKALAVQGFGRVFVIEGGFSGWVSAGLGVKPSRNVSATLIPSFGSSSRSAGSRSISGGIIDVSPIRGLLPPGN